MAAFDLHRVRETYERDGVVFLPRALAPKDVAAALKSYEWSLDHPGPGASKIPQKTTSLFYQDLCNLDCLPAYREMLLSSPLPKLIADIWGTADVWFMYEQVFLKEGGESRRTPWHQDASYLAVGGDDLAVAWITFDAQSKEDSLEFVKGSHKGLLYDGSRFDIDDETLPIYPGDQLPRLPDIEAHRGDFDIVSFAVEPGDVVLFHPKTLHGGAPTHPGTRRRTLTLRFFGEKAFYETRPIPAGPRMPGLHDALKPGDAFRNDGFLKLLPTNNQVGAA
jgi:ectoine hydroxylase-related dioxygenase (phytanoyl-CoA dioxygenase family)